MKSKFYVIIPSVAFILILSNAFYGHSIFSYSYPEDINKYSIYVHFQPEWESHPSNLLFDVTTVWNNADDFEQVYYDELSTPPSLDEHNFNQLQYIGDKSFVELKHRFSDCHSNWQPILYRYAIDSLRNQFESLNGANIENHPYAILYPNNSYFKDYDSMYGYVQFIPICSSKEITSYEYSVKTNDDLGFDVFFIPNISEYEKLIDDPNSLNHYTAPGCFGKSYTSFSGACENVSKDGGLLIWIPDDLSLALTKITVNLREL